MSKLEETMYEFAEKNVCASCHEHNDCAWVIRNLQNKCTYLNDVMYGYELCQQDMAKLVVDVEVANVGILQMGNLLLDKGISAGDKIGLIVIKKD